MNHRALSISTISPFVHEWFLHTDRAKVLQVFKHSSNLINSDKELLSLVMPHVGPGPFSAVLLDDVEEGWRDFSDWMKVGNEVQIEEDRMRLGKVIVDFKNAKLWNPKPDWGNIQAHRDWIMSKVPELMGFLLKEASPHSLVQIVGDLFAGENLHLQSLQPPTDIQNQFRCAASEPARILLKGIATHQSIPWERGFRELLGLGGGLTPAGDDFILGVVFAMQIMLPLAEARDILIPLPLLAEGRTSQLSIAYLRAATDGAVSFPWHSFSKAIIAENSYALYGAARSILKVGETSGSDALTGFISMLGQFRR